MEEEKVVCDPYSGRTLIQFILGRADGGVGLSGQKVRIGAWVKTGRNQGRLTFLSLNDGSCPMDLQVIGSGLEAKQQLTSTGCSVLLEGVLKQPPKSGIKQAVELEVVKVLYVGPVEDASTYPVPKTSVSLEHLRSYSHLRARTSVISAVSRVRDAISIATQTFFHERKFLWVHTPLITTSDCEGAGEMFHVSAEQQQQQQHKERIDEAKREQQQHKENTEKTDEAEHFFGRPAFLTVSGQLQLESYACCLSNVYAFGPTFRAENSHTSRHLSEFWMIEPEIAFAELEGVMQCAEDHIKFLCRWLLDHCYDDMQIFSSGKYDTGAIERLGLVISEPFARLTYTEAIDILKKAGDVCFENKVEWGIDLASEHERYLAEKIYKRPVIVYNYPKKIKAFYMRVNDDGETVAAMDLLMPKVGELVGGSQREERQDVLKKRLEELGLAEAPYQWYMDLRRYGTVKHGGYGLGLERMILFVTGLDNIRDVIPFPRYPGKADL